jgi:hypothetical protein
MAFPADFYSVAAQLIAALFILAAVESRLLVTGDTDEEEAEQAVTVLGWAKIGMAVGVGLGATFALGLGAALVSLYHQNITTHRDIEIVGSLAAELLLVVGMAMACWLVPIGARRAMNAADAGAALREAVRRMPLPADEREREQMVEAVQVIQDTHVRTPAIGARRWIVAGDAILKTNVLVAFAVPAYAIGALIADVL